MRKLVVLAVLFTATSSIAQQPLPAPAKDYAAMSIDELAVELDGIEGSEDVCSVQYPLFRAVAVERPDLEDIVVSANELEILCALHRGQGQEADELVRALEAKGDFSNDNLGLWAAAAAGNGQSAFDRLRKAFRAGNAERVAHLDGGLVIFAAHQARKAGYDEELDVAFVEVAAAGAIGDFPKNIQEMIATGALDAVVRSGDKALAANLLNHIFNPTSFTRYLAGREYQAIWPLVEARVGENYQSVTATYRSDAMAAWQSDRENPDLLAEASHAVYFDGDWQGAVDLVDGATAGADFMATIEQGEAWALNIKAYALDALGRRAQADAVFDALAQLDPDEHSWAVNFAVNRGSRLVGQGRWDEGLQAARLAGEVAAQQGTLFARMLVARDKVCALHHLGRIAEYAEPFGALRENRAEHAMMFAEAAMCLGRDEEAAAALIDALRDDTKRSAILDELQPEAFDLFYTRSILPHPRALIATHQGLREEFLKHVRLIPEKYYPAASLSR